MRLANGQVVAGVSTQTPGIRKVCKNGGNIEAAKIVGKAIADIINSLKKKFDFERICFDRGGCKYTGRVKALADAAREKWFDILGYDLCQVKNKKLKILKQTTATF